MPQRTVQEIYASLQNAVKTALKDELATDGIGLEGLSGRDVAALFSGADDTLWTLAQWYDRMRGRIRTTAAV